jgi:hypothetical protein
MELTRTNRSGGLTTYFSRRWSSRSCDRRHAAPHAAVRGAPGEVQVVTYNHPSPLRCLSASSDGTPSSDRSACSLNEPSCHRARSLLTCARDRRHSRPCFALRQFFLATIPERSHPFPSRTRKLSSPGPMVLQGQPCGRVGRRRGFEGPLSRAGLLLFRPRHSRRPAAADYQGGR